MTFAIFDNHYFTPYNQNMNQKFQSAIDLEGMRQTLGKQPNVLAAYLTGSQARGDPHLGSDVDIAVLFKDAEPVRENYTKIYLEFYSLLAKYAESISERREIDFVFLQALPIPHQFHALSEAKLIYTADLSKTLDYEEFVSRLYADIKPQTDRIFGEYLHQMTYA